MVYYARPNTDEGETLKAEARKKVENAFTATVFVVVIGRFVLAFASFGDRGVNPLIFGALDLISAYPYARYTARVVVALADYDYSRLLWNGAWWLAWFLLPYAYLFYAARNVPIGLWVGVVAWMAVFGIAAVVGMIRKAHQTRTTELEEV